MAKVIVVSGIGNSGKTTSIKQALFMLQSKHPALPVNYLQQGKDVIAVVTFSNPRCVVVFASGGDTVGVLNKLWGMLPVGWDVLVCASKSVGQTVNYTATMAQRHTLIWLKTQYAPAQRVLLSQVTANNILANIP